MKNKTQLNFRSNVARKEEMSGGLDSMFKNKVGLWSPALGGLFRPTAWTPTHDPPADTPVEEGAKTLD